MAHLDDLQTNEENASHLAGRTILKARVIHMGEERALGLWLELDDGSRIAIDGLRSGGVEVNWISPDEAFDLARGVMEEEIAEGRSGPDTGEEPN
jgi:hypothetical protein